MTRLFVIGNGFDIKHGLKTNYQNFKNEVAKNDLKLFEIINKVEKAYNE
ncbi:bacteriophage abortive infection AbiH family protein [Staphylococcus xylosus]|nr:bacteriophage abortive infection AbiH family protein [Staphylococcus xylosus]